jgi:hypothetical protein
VRTDEEGPLEHAAREFAEGDCLQAEANLLLSQLAIYRTRSDAILNQYRISSWSSPHLCHLKKKILIFLCLVAIVFFFVLYRIKKKSFSCELSATKEK